MQKEFVTYELAEILFDTDFNENCLGWYNTKCADNDVGGHSGQFTSMAGWSQGREDTSDLSSHDFIFVAPLWQQVVSWLREKHYIMIIAENDYYRRNNEEIIEYYFTIRKISMTSSESIKTEKTTDYYESLEIALIEAIKLI